MLGLLCALLAAGAGGDYAVDAAKSSLVIQVGKSGLMSFAGHRHVVRATRLEGEIHAAPGDLSRSHVRVSFAAAGLRVDEEGEPKGDAPKVQEAMLAAQVLDAVRFPAVVFQSTAVAGKLRGPDAYDLDLTGDLSLHGVTRRLTLPVRVELEGETLKATGQLVLRQTQYGISPVSVAGVVKVKDELAIEYAIVATQVVR